MTDALGVQWAGYTECRPYQGMHRTLSEETWTSMKVADRRGIVWRPRIKDLVVGTSHLRSAVPRCFRHKFDVWRQISASGDIWELETGFGSGALRMAPYPVMISACSSRLTHLKLALRNPFVGSIPPRAIAHYAVLMPCYCDANFAILRPPQTSV
jgi:hypothetical protein